MLKNRALKIFLLLILLMGLMVGCGASRSTDKYANPSTPPTKVEMEKKVDVNGYETRLGFDRKIIKNGEISLSVKDITEQEKRIAEIISSFGGYIERASQSGGKVYSYLEIVARIPVEKFDPFVSNIRELGEVNYNQVYSDDVTEEFIDLSAREKTLTVQENRLRVLLNQAKTIEEILKIENELSRIRNEIEKVTGRLKYLENKTSFSTITIRLEMQAAPVKSDKVENIFEQIIFSFKDGLGTFSNLIVLMMKVLAFFTPYIIVIAPFGIWIFKKKKAWFNNKVE